MYLIFFTVAKIYSFSSLIASVELPILKLQISLSYQFVSTCTYIFYLRLPYKHLSQSLCRFQTKRERKRKRVKYLNILKINPFVDN